MSWPDGDYSHRIPVVIDGSATAAGPVDATIGLTRDDALFWSTIQADGDDVRVYAADGIATITYDLESFNYSSQTVTVELDNLTHHTTNTMTVVWLLIGNSAATNGEASVTTTSPLTGYTLNIGPAIGETVYGMGSPPGSTTPFQRAQKRSSETAFLWFRVAPLGSRSTPYEGRIEGEEARSLTISVVTPGTFTANISALRLYQVQDGDLFCRATVSGGTDGVTSNIVLSVTTTEGRILQGTVLMTCEDL